MKDLASNFTDPPKKKRNSSNRIMKENPVVIQKFLGQYGFYDGKNDGIVGPKTKAAIKNYQKENNLTVDGIVGEKTLESMRNYGNDDYSTLLDSYLKINEKSLADKF